MKLYSMTATFGKLANETLTLKPGLNVIHAPNEWGKSTWCAFLTAMLYGIDTGERTKKGSLADKERYAPWSGAPMSGRMELNWNGRDITIERKQKGRTPMGDFTAYETGSGLPVAELTAANCGQQLLGVERSVFQRSGFISLSDLPVTQDEALRRRLNALVTTGDETGAADDLAENLKNLKNKCRHNKTGLLPEAEAQRNALTQKLSELDELDRRIRDCRQQQTEVDAYLSQLENHKAALAYADAQAGQQKVLEAARACDEAAQALESAEQTCKSLPSPDTARTRLNTAKALQERQLALNAEALPLPPTAPQAPLRYQNVAPETAVDEAMKDISRERKLTGKKQRNSLILGIYAGISALLLVSLAIPQVRALAWLVGAAIVLGGVATAAVCILRTKKLRDEIEKIYDLHPGQPTHTWLPEAENYQRAYAAYVEESRAFQARQADFTARRAALEAEIAAFAGEKPLQAVLDESTHALTAWDALDRCRDLYQQKVDQAEILRSVVKPAPKPAQPDTLTLSPAATEKAAQEAAFEKQRLHKELGICQGKMENIGNRDSLNAQLEAVNARIARLTDTYAALELALQTLGAASAQLQRRFAPRIQQQAQDIFSRLTAGRYSRMTLSEDLSISTGADTETTLRPALWRSEGTVDQLYLSLRLAVARELTPDAPIVLDDAFARFDDTRLAAALKVLQAEAEQKQILLFSCQTREAEMVK